MEREDSMTSWIPNTQEPSDFQEDNSPPAKRARLVNNGNQIPRSPYKSDRVQDVLRDAGFEKFVNNLKEQKITESQLADIAEDEDKLKELGLNTMGDREEVKKLLKDIKKEDIADNRKVFNDPIHGHIDLHPLCVKIIDTPEFQRLRYLKQLGNCYFVYPGASHNRFEHSIGVCYLAGQLVRALQRRQPTLKITDEDVLCVEIAGLCHDLGHGPFSHLFDGIFIPKAIGKDKKVKWQHEDASKDMFDYMLEKNNLKEQFSEYGLLEMDIEFIKEQVTGPPKETQPSVIWPYKGRSKEQSFLYEIVANKRNSIDVDKWDYFARDCHMLGIKNNFDHDRCIQFAKVIEVNGEKQICSRDKEANNLFDMFYTRQTLHRRAYQHRVTSIIDIMVADAMLLANNHILFVGKDGEKKKMSEAIYDMEAYCKMTDNVFFQILYSTEPHLDLVKARKILEDVLHRRLYKYVSQTQLKPKKKEDLEEVQQKIFDKIKEINKESSIEKEDIIPHKEDMDLEEVQQKIFDKIKEINKESSIEKEDIIPHISTYDYGMKENNPIDNVRFYSKDKPDEAKMVRKHQVSSFIPENFLERNLRLFCKKRDKKSLETVRKAFESWCEENGFASYGRGDVNEFLTPCDKGQKKRAEAPKDVVEKAKSNLFK